MACFPKEDSPWGKINPEKNTLRKFGLILGTVFFLASSYILFRNKYCFTYGFILSAASFISAFALPKQLKPAYIICMRLSLLLARINTVIILSVIFYLLLTPIGLVMRLIGVDLLDRKIEKKKETYWKKKEKRELDNMNYERQF